MMPNNNIESSLKSADELVGNRLRSCFSTVDSDISCLLEAERYSLFSGGKRIRPYLTLECCRMFGGDAEAALPFACAVEMIHTYSLIHDDLPCMDNDDMRRGKPSCHVKFGEATALLAGDALLTHAFGVCAANGHLPSESVRLAVALLSEAAGSFGMIGGQVIDLRGNNERLDYDTFVKLCKMKTGAMISVAAKLGCIAAGIGTDDKRYSDISEYSSLIGLAFQIIDDVIDARQGENHEEKTTFISFFDEKHACEKAEELTDRAVKAIEKYRGSAELCALARFLVSRVT